MPVIVMVMHAIICLLYVASETELHFQWTMS